MMITKTLHIVPVSLQFSFCSWRHNRLLMTSQWADNCDVSMWMMISNSLDIDCIHCDIHTQLCKKLSYFLKKNPVYPHSNFVGQGYKKFRTTRVTPCCYWSLLPIKVTSLICWRFPTIKASPILILLPAPEVSLGLTHLSLGQKRWQQIGEDNFMGHFLG